MLRIRGPKMIRRLVPNGGSVLCAWLGACALANALLCLWPRAAMAGSDEEQFVVVKAGRVITVSGDEYAPGMVVFADGKVSLVGTDLEYPPSAEVIEAPQETVMPGFVLARSRFGLPGYQRAGVHGDQNVSAEVYLEQMDFGDLREAGFTTVCFVPDGRGIPGMACAYRTGGPDESRKISDSVYLDVATDFGSATSGKKLLRGALEKAKKEIEKVEKARKEWEKKQAEKKNKEAEEKEHNGEPEKEEKPAPEEGNTVVSRLSPNGSISDDEPEEGEDEDKKEDAKGEGEQKEDDDEFKPPKIDPKHQPLVDLIQEKEGAQMMVRLERASDLRHLEDVLGPYDKLTHTLFMDIRHRRFESDFHYVIDVLGEKKAKVALYPEIYRMPYTVTRYNLLARLANAGCQITSLPVDDARSEYKELRTKLAQTVRAGLDRNVALKSLTLHPARLLGLGNRLGSIEKDRDGDLVFFRGDPLDPHSKVSRLMILGEIVWTADEDDR